MQLTIEQCDAQIAQIQNKIPELQSQLQQLVGYRQALTEMEKEGEDKNEIGDDGASRVLTAA